MTMLETRASGGPPAVTSGATSGVITRPARKAWLGLGLGLGLGFEGSNPLVFWPNPNPNLRVALEEDLHVPATRLLRVWAKAG